MSHELSQTTQKPDTKVTLAPRLRFPEFRSTDGWKVLTGNRLFEQISDKNPEPGLPVLAITQEHGAIPRDMIDYHVSVTEKSIESYKVVRPGDFIISLRSFQGGIEYSQYHGICSPAYVVLRRRGDGSDAYFKHYLKTEIFIQILTKNLEGLRDGKMVSYKQFSELQFPVASAVEQQKIADCLGSVDELIAVQARKVAVLKTHKKGLMQQLFPCGGETQPRLRFPEFQDAGEWVTKKLGEIAEVVASGDLDSEQYSSNRSGKFIHPVYANGVESEGLYGYYAIPRYQRNSITITARGTLGIAFLRHQNFMGIGRLIVASPAQGVNSHFLKECWSHLARIPHEVTSIPQLTAVTARATVLPFPPLHEQKRISDCLTFIDDTIAAENKRLETLKTHKKGLMQQLFPSLEEAR